MSDYLEVPNRRDPATIAAAIAPNNAADLAFVTRGRSGQAGSDAMLMTETTRRS